MRGMGRRKSPKRRAAITETVKDLGKKTSIYYFKRMRWGISERRRNW